MIMGNEKLRKNTGTVVIEAPRPPAYHLSTTRQSDNPPHSRFFRRRNRPIFAMVNKRALEDALRLSLNGQDPNGVARAICLPPMAANPIGSAPKPTAPLDSFVINSVNYGGLLAALIDANIAAESGHILECYQAQISLHTNLNRALGSTEGNWLIPALAVACRNTHKLALAADKGGRQKDAKLQNAVQILQDSYSKTFNDRTEYQVCV